MLFRILKFNLDPFEVFYYEGWIISTFCYIQRPSVKDKIKCLTNQGDHRWLEIRRNVTWVVILNPKTCLNHYKFQKSLETFKNVKTCTRLVSEAIWEMFAICNRNKHLIRFSSECFIIEFGITKQGWRMVFCPCLFVSRDSQDRSGFGPHVCVSHWWDKTHFFREVGLMFRRGGFYPRATIWGFLAKTAEVPTYRSFYPQLPETMSTRWPRPKPALQRAQDWKASTPKRGTRISSLWEATKKSCPAQGPVRAERSWTAPVNKAGEASRPTRARIQMVPWKQQIPERFWKWRAATSWCLII